MESPPVTEERSRTASDRAAGRVLSSLRTPASLAILAASAILVAPACRSAAQPATNAATPPSPRAQQAPTTAPGTREAARNVELLGKQLVVDRQAVAVAEAHLAGLRDLARAGRVGRPDLQAAELELLQLLSRLHQHELDLAAAERSVAAARAK